MYKCVGLEMQCKSLWIKASAKCINVNVNITQDILYSFEIIILDGIKSMYAPHCITKQHLI